MRSDISQKLVDALHLAIESVLEKENKNRESSVRTKKKIVVSRFNCSRIKPSVSLDDDPHYCKKCILCFLHNQKQKEKVIKLTWAPKKHKVIPSLQRPTRKFYSVSYLLFFCLFLIMIIFFRSSVHYDLF